MKETNSSSKWVADPPLDDIKGDKLSRRDFAEKVAWGIYACEYDREGSLVIGILGDWGTGKTTLKNFILGELKKLWSNDRNAKLPVVEFNPWQLSSQDKVLEGFFEEVGSVFDSKYFKDQKKAKRLAKKWERFRLATLAVGKIAMATTFTVLVVVALISNTISYILSEEAKNILDVISYLSLLCAVIVKIFSPAFMAIGDFLNFKTCTQSLNEAREHLREELKELEFPILVVIDDIDRLTKEEIRLMVQLVKANANFPNIIYLLLFQKDVVASALEEISGSSGMDFLEKIVQIDLQVPTAPDTAMRKMLDDGLKGIWGKYEYKWRKEDQKRWERIFEEGIWPFFETPRDIKRFLNAFGFYFQIHAREGALDVNIIDLVIIEVLRMFNYQTYRIVARSLSNRWSVNALLYANDEESRKKLANDFDELLKNLKLNGVKKTCLKNLFYRLLPQVQENSHVNLELMDRDRRLCHQRHYSKYFQLELDPKDVSAATIAEFIKPTNSPEKLIGMLKQAIQNGKFINFLDRLSLEKEDILKSSIKGIGKALFDISDNLPPLRGPLGFKDEGERQLSRTVVQLLTREKDLQVRNSIAETIVNLTHTIKGPVRFVHLAGSYNNTQPHGFELLSPNSVEKIKALLVKRLWEFAESGKLWEIEGALLFLYDLANWDNEEKVRNWLNDEIKDPSKSAKFVRQMLNERISDKITYYINTDSWKRLVDLRELVESATEAASGEPTKTAVEKLTRALDNADTGESLPQSIEVIKHLSDGTYESIKEDF